MFLVPKVLPGGERNRYVIRRLKEKLGSRSMPTGEYEFEGAVGYVVGAIDRGFPQMAEMINVSRLSNGMRAAALMRRSLLEAVTHARGRAAFGKALFDLPLVREQLFEMVLDSEAALAIVLFAAQALDRADGGSEHDELVVRIVTPLIKYANCRRARWTTGMAMNIRGGNGYIEEWVNARLLRDAHLGSIWEGAENVVALDVARAAMRNGAHEALFRELETRLDEVADETARAEAAAARDALEGVRRRFEALLTAAEDEREAKMAAMCDRLAAAVCTALLTVEGDREARSGQGYGKLLAAREYRRRYLERVDPLDADNAVLRWLGPLVDGAPVPASALG
jgi:hypothetical protein